jgi:hypothetical protein
MKRAQLTVKTDGRYLCVEVTNLGPPETFSAIVQPGRGTASAALARTALWHDSTEADRQLATGESATVRLAHRDRPPGEHEDDDSKHVHPEGPQAWRMWFLRRGVGASVERVCPVVPRDGSPGHDGITLTVMCDRRMIVKSLLLEGDVAVDADGGQQFRVMDSSRHYHLKPH